MNVLRCRNPFDLLFQPGHKKGPQDECGMVKQDRRSEQASLRHRKRTQDITDHNIRSNAGIRLSPQEQSEKEHARHGGTDQKDLQELLSVFRCRFF